MRRIVAIVIAAALAFGLVACSMARADTDIPDSGSVSGSVQQVQIDPAAVGPEESQEPEIPDIPEYDPIDLKRDNPLADAEIVSVTLHLSAVGEYEITGDDAQTIKEIAQNPSRIWQDSSGWDFFDAKYISYTDYPTRLKVTLDSGETLDLRVLEVRGESTNILRINDEEYDLSPEEYTAFEDVHGRAYEELCAGLDGRIMPFADLVADDLARITRVRHYTEADQSEQVLTDEQVQMVLDSLHELELEPSVAIFHPELLAGAGYECFMLEFKNGESYYVGAYERYGIWNDDNTEEVDRFPVAMVDGVLYRCNQEYASDMYWDYEETSGYYEPRYLSAREIPEYPFADITADEIKDIRVGVTKDGKWDRVEISLDLADDVVEVLKQIRYADDNKLERPDVSFDVSVQRSNQITIYVNGYEQVGLGVDDGHLVMNQSDYIEDEGMIEALEDLIARANSELG